MPAWRPLPDGTPAHIRIYLIFSSNTVIGLHFSANGMNLSSLKFLGWAPECLFISATVTFRPFKVIIIVIIIMTRRRLWSIATTLHDVHAPLPSTTSVSSWLLFCRQSAVSMSFEDDQEVFASSYLSSGQLSLQWLASRLGVQVRWYPVWRLITCPNSAWRFLSTVSNVRQASCISYVDVLHVILPSDALPCIWRWSFILVPIESAYEIS